MARTLGIARTLRNKCPRSRPQTCLIGNRSPTSNKKYRKTPFPQLNVVLMRLRELSREPPLLGRMTQQRSFGQKINNGPVDDNFTCLFKIHCNFVVNHRLHLSKPPFGFVWMAYKLPGFQKSVHLIYLTPVSEPPKMTIHNVDLSALISTRICHDLINPIGAINNGLELLGAIGTAPGPELNLVNDSASAASAKLNIFRLAFGDITSSSEVKGDKVAQMIADMYGDSKLAIDWQPTDVGFPRAEIKLVLLILFCIETSLPLGGSCAISTSQGIWTFKANAQKFNIRPDLWDMVTGAKPAADTSASDVHHLVARMTADHIGRSVKLHERDAELIVMIT